MLYSADAWVPVQGFVRSWADLGRPRLFRAPFGVGESLGKGEGKAGPGGLGPAWAEAAHVASEGRPGAAERHQSTALALYNMFAIEDLYRTALVAGALSVDAAAGSVKPFDARIHDCAAIMARSKRQRLTVRC